MKPKSLIFPILAFGFACFVTYIIYIANTGTPSSFMNMMMGIPYSDKLGHFLLIGGMSFLLNLALKLKKIQILKFSLLLGSLIVFTLISLEEFSQLFNSKRTFDLVDLFFNYLGIFVFGKLAEYFGKRMW